MTEHELSHPWLIAGAILAGGVLLGWVVDRVVRVRLLAWAKTTPWKGDEIILNAVRGLIWLWVSLIGLHVAAHVAQLSPRVADLCGRAVEIGFIVSITLALSRIAVGSLQLYTERINLKGGASVVTLVVKAVLFTLGALVILETEGISIAPMLTALGVGGLAVALALQDTLGNIFAGINTLMAGQIRPGDFIKIDADNEGYVIDVGWRNTSVRTLANNLVVVPNKRLAESIVTNYCKPEPHLSLVVPVGVAYESDLAQVEALLLEIGANLAATYPGVLTDPPPAVRFAAFADSSIETRLVLRVETIEVLYLLRHHAIKAIHARFRASGISIAYPTRTLHMVASAAAVAVPAAGGPPTVGMLPDGRIDGAAVDHD
jgi:small-conductance mechanosensitive channel